MDIIMYRRSQKNFIARAMAWGLMFSAIIVMTNFGLQYLALGLGLGAFYYDYWHLHK